MSVPASLAGSSNMVTGGANTGFGNLSPEFQVVRLRNEGDTPFSQKYAGVRYIIPPGSETIVPFMAMCLWLGHPNAVDMDKKRRFRTQEFQRLCVKWGVYEHYEDVETKFPKVTAWDIITNEELITVVKDPDGKHLTPDVQTRLERDTMAEQMVAMQKQIAHLQAQMDQKSRELAAQTAAGDTRTDNPTHRPEIQVTDPGPKQEFDPMDLEAAGVAIESQEIDQTGGAMIDRPTPKPVRSAS